MEDDVIIDLYFKRSEKAIRETKIKYSHMLCSIALGILKNMEDAEECENATYLKTWNVIPPERPNIFSAFLSRIIRNMSLDRYKYNKAQKRGTGEIPLLIDELEECIPDKNNVEEGADGEALKNILNSFLNSLTKDTRIIFMRRYWFGDSIQEISEKYGYGISKIKTSLMRSRKKLRELLATEGYVV